MNSQIGHIDPLGCYSTKQSCFAALEESDQWDYEHGGNLDPSVLFLQIIPAISHLVLPVFAKFPAMPIL